MSPEERAFLYLFLRTVWTITRPVWVYVGIVLVVAGSVLAGAWLMAEATR